jgi:acyl-CoA dehydrogenase
MGIGIARAAYDIALKFVEEDYPKHAAGRLRKALEQLVAMQRKIMLSRLLCLKAASLLDQGKPNALAASSAKQYAPPMCLEVVEHATDILGEAGIAKDGLLEKLARDVKAIDIVEGTQQIQRRVISKNIISR